MAQGIVTKNKYSESLIMCLLNFAGP